MAMGDLWWRSDSLRLLASARLATLLARLHEEHTTEAQTPANDVITRSERYARSRLSHGVNVQDMARHVGLGRVRFQQRYREARGKSPSRFLSEERMALSVRLLQESSLNLEQVSIRVGYRSRSAFTEAFRRNVGCTPAQWRRSHREMGQPAKEKAPNVDAFNSTLRYRPK